MNRILVLDANQRSALAVTRSLGSHSISVFTSDATKTSLAGSSRYSAKYFTYPDPVKDTDKFTTFIAKLATEQDISILLPMTELTISIVLENRHLFEKCILPFPDLKQLNKASDKCSLMHLARSLDVPIPETAFIEPDSKSPVELSFGKLPVILKPGKSWLYQDNQWLHTTVRLAKTTDEAHDILTTDPAFQHHPYMIQECIEGTGQGIFAIYNRGRALAFFSHKRIREKPPWGGVSVLSESTAVAPVLKTHAKKLLDASNWHGIAMVEFKVSKDGTPYLMEINTRFWGSLQLAVDSGVDFPWMLYQLATGEAVEPVKSYKTGKRLRWLLGDLDALYLTLKQPEKGFLQKIRVILMFMKPSLFRTRHEVNRLSDIRPFLWELNQYVKDLFH